VRILTIGEDGSAPLELGAEFIHGTKNPVCELVAEAGWRPKAAVEKQWVFDGRTFRPAREIYEGLSSLFKQVNVEGRDTSFDSFVASQDYPEAWFARMFVEGFDAADTSRVSAQALAKAELSEEGGEDK